MQGIRRVIGLLVLSVIVLAALRAQLVQDQYAFSGKPKVGTLETPKPLPATSAMAQTTHQQMDSFEACLAVIAKTATDTGVAPVNIVETTAMRMVRFPVADGSVLITCTKDGNMAVTRSTKRCGVDVEC